MQEPMAAAPGMVKSHAHAMRWVTPQRTAVRRRDAPTPTIPPVIVWVVLTGMPKWAVPMSVIAPAVSAEKPPKGVSLVMRWPIVLTTRQPPAMVPQPIAMWQVIMTQKGTEYVASNPPETSAAVMIPMVFCASLVPCPRLYPAADMS